MMEKYIMRGMLLAFEWCKAGRGKIVCTSHVSNETRVAKGYRLYKLLLEKFANPKLYNKHGFLACTVKGNMLSALEWCSSYNMYGEKKVIGFIYYF